MVLSTEKSPPRTARKRRAARQLALSEPRVLTTRSEHRSREPPSPSCRAPGGPDLPARALYRCWGPWPCGRAPPSPAAPPPGPWGPARTRPPAAPRAPRRRGRGPSRGHSPQGPPGSRARPRRRGSRPRHSRRAPSWPRALGSHSPAAPLIDSEPAPPHPARRRRRARPSPPDLWLGARRPALRVRGKQLNAPDYLASCLISGTLRVGYFGSFTWARLYRPPPPTPSLPLPMPRAASEHLQESPCVASRRGLDWNCRVWSAEGMRSRGPQNRAGGKGGCSCPGGAASQTRESGVGTDLGVAGWASREAVGSSVGGSQLLFFLRRNKEVFPQSLAAHYLCDSESRLCVLKTSDFSNTHF